MSIKAYKYRIYLNKNQKVLVEKTFGAVRYVWNLCVEKFNNFQKEDRTPTQLREEIAWLKEVSYYSINQKMRDFDCFKNKFFDKENKIKMGRPKFKSKRKKQSFRVGNDKFYVDRITNRIRIAKIGWIKVVFDRKIPLDAKILTITISKDLIGDYFVSICVEENINYKLKTGKEVGIDVGLKNFVTLSNGAVFENPKFFRESQSELRRIQKHLSRKKVGSNHFNKNRIKVAKIHRKIARQREFFLHNLSFYLVSTFDILAIEDLNILGMLKNKYLSKSILDASWYEFGRQLKYKSNWYGKEVRIIDRFEPTSKTCSVCGYYYKDMSLKIREWVCPICNTKHDRDFNASKNILKHAVGITTELQTWRECKTSLDAIPYEVLKNL